MGPTMPEISCLQIDEQTLTEAKSLSLPGWNGPPKVRSVEHKSPSKALSKKRCVGMCVRVCTSRLVDF